MVSALDPNKSVIKRLWCIVQVQYPIVFYPYNNVKGVHTETNHLGSKKQLSSITTHVLMSFLYKGDPGFF